MLPPNPPLKNIVLFMDGTWNKASKKNVTNVRKMFERVYSRSGPGQIVHYIQGVGESQEAYAELPLWAKRAGIPPEPNNIFAKTMRKCLGGAFGYGMPAKVMEAYAFLVAHYNVGDRIYLFGFSRGAYAVRSLTCFLEEVGLLLKDQLHEVPSAYRLYSSGDKVGIAKLTGRLQALTGFLRAGNDGPYRLPVHMMGVWDTVGAMKFTKNHVAFRPDDIVIDVPQNISHVRHALALHELREQFEPLFWRTSGAQSLEQVWFAGAHADVGGGYSPSAVANIALEWMAHEAQKLYLDIDAFSEQADSAVGLNEIRNSFAPWFGYAAPTIRSILSEGKDSFFEKDLNSFAVHHTVAKRLAKRGMSPYQYLWPEVDQLLAAVDEASVNLVWALGLTHGQLLVGSQQRNLAVDRAFLARLKEVMPKRLQNLTATGADINAAQTLIREHLSEGVCDIDELALSILIHTIFNNDLDLDYLTGQLAELHEYLHKLFASSAETGAVEESAARVKSVADSLLVASRLAPSSQMSAQLLALSEQLELVYAIGVHTKGAVARIKRKVRKL